jgi:hypothetical protein
MKTPESYEKEEIDAFLEKLGPDHVWYFKPYMAGFGKAGVPDYCLCIAHAFWTFEVKRPGKEPTAIQRRRMDEVVRAGGQTVAGTADVIIEVVVNWLAVRGIVVSA